MNKSSRHPKLPSITTLLTYTPPSPPPRIIVEVDDQQQNDSSVISEKHGQDLLLLPSTYLTKSCSNDQPSITLSPILSPIDSYASSIHNTFLSPPASFQPPPSPLPSPSMLSLPPTNLLPAPLQGDDPPRTLFKRHSSSSPKPTSLDTHWPSNSHFCGGSIPNSPCSCDSLSPSSSSDQHYNSPTMMSIDETSINSSRSPSPAPPSSSSSSLTPLLPSTQIVLSESGHPIIKRRRGRPPSQGNSALEGGWTFLTPTVWDVAGQQQLTTTQQQHTATDAIMIGSMAAFTSANMDIVLQMPRKKRGRKPKTHIIGNSCFVWKEMIATRRSTKVIKEQQQQQLQLQLQLQQEANTK